MEFQTQSNRKITFESINQSFYNDFLKFSVATKKTISKYTSSKYRAIQNVFTLVSQK